jgi:hypothetical protein
MPVPRLHERALIIFETVAGDHRSGRTSARVISRMGGYQRLFTRTTKGGDGGSEAGLGAATVSRLIALDFQRKVSVGPGSTSNETEHQVMFEIVFLAFPITALLHLPKDVRRMRKRKRSRLSKLSVEADGETDRPMAQTSAAHCQQVMKSSFL